ncbi:unnamed protein product [Lactuca virosa]|uniref:Uncharacterized protein n=1 Tax=Lactuca virosa TaxID=75947 RepID=A0AAU9N843_9ASTR|nr:unnamed protein product [Lactuca virosa]
MWLGDTKILENEIPFASGKGVGLANINALEAIAGKCNVVCVSKDRRNPQRSDDELKATNFIFYRTFDVENCTISDKMDKRVGGIKIKYVFNALVGSLDTRFFLYQSLRRSVRISLKEQSQVRFGD